MLGREQHSNVNRQKNDNYEHLLFIVLLKSGGGDKEIAFKLLDNFSVIASEYEET